HAEDEAAPEPVPQSDSEAARAGKTPSSTDNGSGEDGGDRRGADERANDDGAGDNSVNDVGAVRMLETRDRRQEVVAWARQIDRWIRLDRDPVERGAIAVLVRDVDPYRDLVREIFGRYEIPYFLDERRSVLAQVRVRLLLGSLEVIASEWRREAVIALLRNPVLGHAPAVVDLLENLSLEYGRNYERWYDETWFEYSHPPRARYHDTQDDLLPEVPDEKQPDDADEEESEVEQDYEPVREEAEEQRRVGLTEPARRRTLLPLARLERRWRTESWTGKQAVREVRAFLDGLDALSDRDRPDSVSSPHAEWDDRVRQSLEDLLDEMEQIWSDLPVTVEEFARTLREGLLALRLGVTPIRQDQVLVGDVQRSRVHGLRRVIVGGVNDGVFPRAVADDPVLGERDRAALVQLGVPLGPTAEERQEEEAYLFYIAMTRASEQVVLTWTRLDPHGKETPPSPLLEELVDAVPGIERAEEVLSDPDELALGKVQTPRELGGKLLAHLSKLWHERSHAREAERQDAERQDAERQEEDRLVEAALAVVHPEMEPRALLTEPMEAPDLLSTPTEPWPRNEEGHGPSFVREKGAPARELAPERSRLDPSIGVERSLLEAQRE
ncbi:MAG: hypothetical protein KC729_20370, partial [Candidatus Eisenbacteria bacterium]|nr:hypothetical protein [Candidatus Eisenbacteria bacterium]